MPAVVKAARADRFSPEGELRVVVSYVDGYSGFGLPPFSLGTTRLAFILTLLHGLFVLALDQPGAAQP